MNDIKIELEEQIKDCEFKDESRYCIDSFRAGYLLALSRFAYWKDGVEYVGSCGTSLKTARKELEDVIEEV